MKRVRPYLLVSLCAALWLPWGVIHAQSTDLVETRPRAGDLDRVVEFSIALQPLSSALIEFADQSGIQVVTAGEEVARLQTQGVSGAHSISAALNLLLKGTGLRFAPVGASTVALMGPQAAVGSETKSEGTDAAVAASVEADMEGAPAPVSTPGTTGIAQGTRRDGIEEIIVTGQKKEERLLDVPIAISAFSAEDLDHRKIEGGSELLRAIPNVTFSKGNFSMYNFSIRGIGTKAVSSSTDPAVAVSFNSTPLIRNRLFEQEYLDVERVEVLRGPQGTLYGRNATAGVVNMIPNLPGYDFEGFLKGEVGNYGSRRMSTMVNVPVTDRFALRIAGAMTQRDGFDFNSFNGTHVNDRDLWSGRLSARFDATDSIRATLIWEHFEEDDQRSRTGKQLCNHDPGPDTLGTTAVGAGFRPQLSQGCLPGSLYADEAFGVPNAQSLPHVFLVSGNLVHGALRYPDGSYERLGVIVNDPYAGLQQSRNLREIATSYDPVFEARNDVVQFNLNIDLARGLSFVSQSAYARDQYYASQDYNRFVSNPIFSDSNHPLLRAWAYPTYRVVGGSTPGGVYTDPQLGPSSRMLSVDISRSDNEQWSQEFRLQSNWEGPLNFSIGANYLDFQSQDDYYVFNNLFSMIAERFYNGDRHIDSVAMIEYQTSRPCNPTGPDDAGPDCIYIDPNPLDQINGDGHNYFRSKNVVHTRSGGLFGELYWQMTDALKLTTGLRYTEDRKTSTPYPSQLLLGLGTGMTGSTGGKTAIGYPASPDIEQDWRRVTGRLVLDWKPDLAFTDDTLVYASYARGYKGGGSNPPRVDIDPNVVKFEPLPETFAPEYVDAFEVGMKNSLMDGRVALSATAFFYNYDNYQVSQIVDRISLNENFDARSMGVELEASLRPIPVVRLDANVGYLKTRIGDGSQSIDVMDRTQGNEDWVVVRPWIQVPSNCVAPREAVEKILGSPFGADPDLGRFAMAALCAGSARLGNYDPTVPAGPLPFWALAGFLYNPMLPYDPSLSPLGTVGSTDPRSGAPNTGRGFYADLGGNELPNSPRWTANFGAQYTFLLQDWNLTVRGDYYWQDESYARVYNTEYDRLRSWDNTNFSLTLEQPRNGLTFQAYVKNAFDKTPITDAFTNSDDTGLTTNVFTLDPRLVGVSIRKDF